MRIRCQAPEGILGLAPLVSYQNSTLRSTRHQTCHNTLRQVRLRNEDYARILENLDKIGILMRWLERSANVSKRRVISFDTELIFDGHRHAMQWSDSSSSPSEVIIEFLSSLNGILEEDL